MDRNPNWFEEDAFWRFSEATLFRPQRLEAAVGEVDLLLERLALPAGAAVLDLCCGPGRHALEFARRGFRVTGVDRTPRYLARARAAAEAEGLAVEWVEQDMRRFERSEAFDAAINMFTSFGYFEAPDDDRRVIDHLHRSLAPGGRLLIDTMGKEVLARIYQPSHWYESDEGALILEEREVEPDWSRVHMRWIQVEEGRREEMLLSLRLYAATELADLARAAGFEQIEVFGDLAGAPYDTKAMRLVLLARKAA
jgi:SAM-dependent methyltransferase